jgi:hypothetical protein
VLDRFDVVTAFQKFLDEFFTGDGIVRAATAYGSLMPQGN